LLNRCRAWCLPLGLGLLEWCKTAPMTGLRRRRITINDVAWLAEIAGRYSLHDGWVANCVTYIQAGLRNQSLAVSLTWMLSWACGFDCERLRLNLCRGSLKQW
jgi:hypothetical protein